MIEIRLRQSWINTFLKCPEQARQDRLGLVTQKESSDFLRGNAVHGAIEYAGRLMLAGMPRPELSEIIEVAEEFIVSYSSAVEVWRHHYESLVDTVRANLTCWYEELFPDLDPVGVEIPFEKEIGRRDNVRLVLTGTVDWVDKSGVIWDWKNPSREYLAWEYKRWDIQSHAYCWALEATDFNLGVLVDGTLQVVEIERTEEDKNSFVELCWSMVPIIMSDAKTWPQNWSGWHCSPKWCPVWQAGECRGKHLGENPW
jgi:hypothetical protein